MPNFLSIANGVGNSIRTSGASGLFNPSGFQGASTAGLSTTFSTGNLGAGVGAALAPLGLGALGLPGLLGGKGTKPKALHTEYAEEDANWSKPYGMGTDIVFYLQRADQTSSISDTNNNFGGDLSKNQGPDFNGQADTLTTGALPSNVGGVELSRIPADVQAGPNSLISNSQSPFSQIASAATIGGVIGGIQRLASGNRYAKTLAGSLPTAVGFLSNLNKNKSVPVGSNLAANSAQTASLGNNSRNITSAGSGALSRYSPGIASGTEYFSEIAGEAFNPAGTAPFQVPTSEFASAFSSATGGVNGSQYLKDLATAGNLGYTAPAAVASNALDFSEGFNSGLSLGSTSSNDVPSEWYFITAPQDISWSKQSSAKEINTYGSNSSYYSYGSTKLRKLKLGQVLVEGFSDGKAIEDNILQLEKCMKMVLNEGNGFASPYCWRVYAGGKCYGTFLITNISVKESMRDMSGHATRAMVDIELQEVPAYQVSSGVDLASKDYTAVSSEAFQANRRKAIENAKSRSKSRSSAGSQATSGEAGSQDENVQANKPEPVEIPNSIGTEDIPVIPLVDPPEEAPERVLRDSIRQSGGGFF